MSNLPAIRQNPSQANLSDMIRANGQALANIASSSLDLDRLCQLVINQTGDKLMNCTASSIFRCLRECAEVGLNPNTSQGHCYIIPRGNEATFQMGYRGYLELFRRSGLGQNINAFPVFTGDSFHVSLGSSPKIDHFPNYDASQTWQTLKAVYAIANLKDGSMQHRVMTKAQVELIKGRSKAGNSGPWLTDPIEMALKTVVRNLSKYLPLSPEQSLAVQTDELEDYGPIEEPVSTPTPSPPKAANAPRPTPPATQNPVAEPELPTKSQRIKESVTARLKAIGYEGEVQTMIYRVLGEETGYSLTPVHYEQALEKSEGYWADEWEQMKQAKHLKEIADEKDAVEDEAGEAGWGEAPATVKAEPKADDPFDDGTDVIIKPKAKPASSAATVAAMSR